MPTNKDLKRLVRARMQKTGEAYTTARADLIIKKQSSPRAPAYAKLAGMNDATIKAKTGCTWERWVKALDRVEAHTWPHGRIAKYVHEKYQVPGWWSQSVTVGYERIKGLLELYFVGKGAGKSQVAVQHTKLADKAAVPRCVTLAQFCL